MLRSVSERYNSDGDEEYKESLTPMNDFILHYSLLKHQKVLRSPT